MQNKTMQNSMRPELGTGNRGFSDFWEFPVFPAFSEIVHHE